MLTKQISVFFALFFHLRVFVSSIQLQNVFSNFFPLANTFQYFITFPLPFTYQLFPDLCSGLLLLFLS